MKSQYIIILTIILATVTSMFLLAKIEDDQRTNNQDFWSIYFVDPLGTDNHFVIDNKTPETQIFHYDVVINDNSIDSGNIEIERGDRKLVELKKQDTALPIKITVINGDNKKEIAKK